MYRRGVLEELHSYIQFYIPSVASHLVRDDSFDIIDRRVFRLIHNSMLYVGSLPCLQESLN